MDNRKLLETILPSLVEYEIEILKNCGEEFILDFKTFNPTDGSNCFYGQIFKSSNSEGALNFKQENKIPFPIPYVDEKSGLCTAFEIWSFYKWEQHEKQDVIDVLDEFVTWENKPSIEKSKSKYHIKIQD